MIAPVVRRRLTRPIALSPRPAFTRRNFSVSLRQCRQKGKDKNESTSLNSEVLRTLGVGSLKRILKAQSAIEALQERVEKLQSQLAQDRDEESQPKQEKRIAKERQKQETEPKQEKPVSRLASLKKKNKSDAATGESKRYILGQPADQPIRTRFAPSPTGYMHLGSLRTALFNNVVARASKDGQFIVRIEDTDQDRLVPDAEERILKDLDWAELSWDEGPDKGGPYGPYRQSERLHIYKEHIQTLLDNKSAYRCFCSSPDLEAQKRVLHDAGKPTVYPGTCRSISPEEADRRAADGEAHVVRLNAGKFGNPKFKDAIYGPFQKKEGEEDFVLMKTDGYPTYHFANVVDDHLMKITHVIRGEVDRPLSPVLSSSTVVNKVQEWLISTPKHLALYEAFGWTPPTFAHLGLLINEDGSKLSKRNDSVNLSTYRDQHVFPMALLVWLSTLGSSLVKMKKDEVPMTLTQIVDALSFKFTRGGIKLNPKKLQHYNSAYRATLLHGKPPSERTSRESALISDLLVTPLLDELQALASGNSPVAIHPRGTTTPWPQPLDLVPALQDPSTQADYILGVISRETQTFTSTFCLIHSEPYYFIRVPPAIYRASLTTAPIPFSLITRIHAAIHDESIPSDAVIETLRPDPTSTEEIKAFHDTLRFIAVGSQEAITRGTGVLFQAIGREEWKYRAGVVKALVKELDEGGEELRQRWVQEAAGLSEQS